MNFPVSVAVAIEVTLFVLILTALCVTICPFCCLCGFKIPLRNPRSAICTIGITR